MSNLPKEEKIIKKLYVISPKIKWKIFKLLQETIVKDSGPTPRQLDKILWEMIKDKKVFGWFCEEMGFDMGIGGELPPHKQLFVIK